jgi:hypothetical protein
MRPRRLIRSAIVVKPSTLLSLHRALTQRTYRRLFSSKVSTKPGPKGPTQEVIAAVVDMKRRNPTWGVRGSLNRSPWPSAFPSPRMWCGAFSPFGIPVDTRLAGTVLAHRARSHEGQSVASRFVPMRIGRPAHPLGACGDGPLLSGSKNRAGKRIRAESQ